MITGCGSGENGGFRGWNQDVLCSPYGENGTEGEGMFTSTNETLYAGFLNIEIEVDGSIMNFRIYSLDGKTIYDMRTIDLTKQRDGVSAISNVWSSGKLALCDYDGDTILTIASLKIEAPEETIVQGKIRDAAASCVDQTVTYSAFVENNTGANLTEPALLVAVFDANQTLIALEKATYDGGAGVKKISGDITLSENAMPHEVRLFFWTDLSTITPLSTPAAVTLS